MSELVHHYKVLKQFLDISDDLGSRNKSNSNRAVRAREKLLKLSGAQFKELSTDVYDELRRRIDESRGEPDYLLPKSSFHPKRNQARQKLSSLPQTRFKDLVSDISYEIERRNLHVDQTPSAPDNATITTRDSTTTGSATTTTPTANHFPHTDASPTSYADLHEREANTSKDSAQNQTIGIQSKTVVPTKANLTWSSDEEDEVEDEKPRNIAPFHNANAAALEQESVKKDLIIEDLKNSLTALEQDHNLLLEKYKLLQDDYEYTSSQNKTLSQEIDQLSEERRAWQENKGGAEQDNEIEKLKAANAGLRLENQSLKNSRGSRNSRDLNSLVSDPTSNNTTVLAAPVSLNSSSSSSIKKDLETFLDKLDSIEPSKKGANSNNLKKEVSKWQAKYEEARSNTIATNIKRSGLDGKDLKSFVTPRGLISIKLVADLQALIETFIIDLSSDTFDADILFEKISKISIFANEIATQGDHLVLNSNELSICLREAISYALTATRYFAVYSAVLPKIVVERAIGEVSFTLCDLVSTSKLNDNSINSRTVQSSGAVPAPVVKEEFGVRPLRMANKLRENQSLNIDPFAANKQIDSGETAKPAETISQGFLRNFSPFGKKNVVNNPPSTTTNTSALKHKDAPSNNRVHFGESAEEIPPAKDLDDSPVKQKTVEPLRPAGRQVEPESPTFSHKRGDSTNSYKSIDSDILNRTSSIQSNEKLTPKASPNGKIGALASKFEQSPPESDRSGIQNGIKQSPKGKGIASLASKFNNSTDNLSKPQSPPRATPAGKKSIFDRVRKFESPTDSTEGGKDEIASSPKLNHSKSSIIGDEELENESANNSVIKHNKKLSEPFEAVAEESAVNGHSGAKIAAAGAAVVGATAVGASETAKGKGLFSSIRDRLNSDDTDQIASENEKGDTSNEKILSSTAETTPSGDIHEDALPVKTGGLFLAIKQKLGGDHDGSDTSLATVQGGVPPLQSKAVEPKAVATPPIAKKVNYVAESKKMEESEEESDEEESDEEESETEEETEARQRQEYRKSMAAATFNVDLFDIDDPDNTLTQVLLYLEHQTVQVISTIQSLLSAIKKPNATRGDLREKSLAITEVISQMTEATNTSMNQTRNAQLKEHGSWVVKSLEDCNHRMNILCKPNSDKSDGDFADKNFKQRLAGISFDIAKCTKELVKTVEEASLKEDIAQLDARLVHADDLT